MKTNVLFFAAVLLLFTACQKDNANDMVSILKNDIQEEVQQVLHDSDVKMLNLETNLKSQICDGPLFMDELQNIVSNFQKEANKGCQTLIKPVSGCHEGFPTHGMALIKPNATGCLQINKIDTQ